MAYGAGMTAYRSKMQATADNHGIDWTILFQMLQQLLAGCGVMSVARLRLLSLNRGYVATATKTRFPELSDSECYAIANDHRDAVRGSTREELQSVIDDCCHRYGGAE